MPHKDVLPSSSYSFIWSHPTGSTGHSLKSTPKYLDDSVERQNELGLVSKDSHCKAVVSEVYRRGAEIQRAETDTGFERSSPEGSYERLAVHENCVFCRPKTEVIPLG